MFAPLRQLLFTFFTLTLLALNGVANAADLTSAHLQVSSEKTELRLQLSGDVKYRQFGLSNPSRVVVDLIATTSKLRGKSPSGGVVKNIRTGLRNGGADLRVVLDLSEAAARDVTKVRTANGVVLVVSLRHSSAKAVSAPVVKPAVLKPAVKPQPPAKPAKPAAPQVVKKEVKKRRPVRIVIDAGHGGKDTGAIGPSGTREKDVALSVSKRLFQILKDSPDFAPVMSRGGDSFLKLRRRINVARDNRADAFVSVHANSFTDRRVYGGAVYALSVGGATSEHARWLAERENAADLVGGVSIHDKENSLAAVLLDLSQTATLEASIELADNVLRELGAIGPLHKKTVQQAGFLVLKSPDIPSILVETAYISNPKEERKLRDARYQQKLANAMFRGLRNFFVANPPPGTLFAQHGGDYIVRRGDTMSALAQRWGTSVNAIRRANNLKNSGLEVGQQLVIP